MGLGRLRRACAGGLAVLLGLGGLAIIDELPAAAVAGELDPTFGAGGTHSQAAPGSVVGDFQAAVAVADPAGRILIGGSDTNETASRDSVLARITQDGIADSTFQGGTTGVEWDAGGTGRPDRVTGIAVNPATGDIFTASSYGAGGSTSDGYVRVERMTPDGVGTAVIPRTFGPGITDGQLAFVNGRLVLAATYSGAGPHDFDGVYVAALTPNLQTDVTFAGDGDMVATTGLRTVFQALAVEATGRILVGAHQGAGTTGAQVMAVTSAGVLDTSFGGGDGQALVQVTGDDWVTSIATGGPGGNIAVGGRAFPNSHVSVLSPAGAPIIGFDGDGKKPVSGGLWSVAWDGAGRIAFADESNGVTGRLRDTGAFDTAYAGTGRTAASCAGARSPQVLVQPSRVIAVGNCNARMFAAGFQASSSSVSAVAFEVTPTVDAGREQVALGDLDISGLSGGFAALQSAPLRGSPLRGSPLRGSPLRGSPLRGSPLRGSPLRGSPLRGSPLRGSALPIPIPLSSIPLLHDYDAQGNEIAGMTWEEVLAGTPFAGLPLQSVTLQDVLSGAPDALSSLTLAHVDLSQSPLRGSSFAATFLWGVPLPTLPPPGTVEKVFAPEEQAAAAWCDFLSTAVPSRGVCGGFSVGETDLLDLELAGVDLAPYYAEPLSLVGVPLRGSSTIGDESPIGNVFLTDVELSNTPLGGLPIDLALEGGLVRCPLGGEECPATIAELQDVAPESIERDKRVADLVELVITNGFLDDLTLGDVLAGLFRVEDLPLEELPLDELLEQATLRSTGNVTHTVSFTRDCTIPGTPAVSVTVPPATRPVRTSATAMSGIDASSLAPAGVPSMSTTALPDGGTRVTLGTPGATCPAGAISRVVELNFDAEPGVALGAYRATATVASGGTDLVLPATPGAVIDGRDGTDNDPVTATPASRDVLFTGHISAPGDVDHWTFAPPEPGSTVTISLSHLPADYDLVVYGEGTDVAPSPLRGSPLRGSPLRGSPLRGSPLRGSAVGDETDDPAADATTLAPEGLADVPLRGSPLRGSSITRGAETESVTTIVRSADVGPGKGFGIQVSGFDGASSNQPYVLRVKVTAGPVPQPCIDRAYPVPSVVGSAVAPTGHEDVQTLVLVNESRMRAVHPTGVDSMMTELLLMAARPHVKGLIVPLDASAEVQAAYASWDETPQATCSPEKANAVVTAINGVVDGLRPSLPNLRHLLVVGSDEVIPQARVTDLTGLANQVEYTDAVRYTGNDNPISSAFLNGFVLSDEPYGDFDPQPWLSGSFYVSDVGLGRLVETPAEIARTVASYNATYSATDPSLHGALDPTTGYVAGYDFLVDGAQTIAGALGGRAPTALEVSPDWTAAQALTGIQGDGAGRRFVSVNAHYDHYEALPAKEFQDGGTADLLHTGQLEQSMLGSILFTIGCEAGLNVPDVYVTGPQAPEDAASLLDWAQRTGQLGGSFTGNTGYGYGDTDAVAYSERLFAYYAENLASGAMTIGQALMFAKQRFSGELGVAGVYDAKAIEEAMTFGLPFWRIGGSGDIAVPALPTLADEPADIDLTTTTFGGSGTFGDFIVTEEVLSDGLAAAERYWKVPGQAPQVTHLRPIQPRMSQRFPSNGQERIHGVVLTAATSTDIPDVDPSYSVPTVDLEAHEPEPGIRSVVFPAALQAVNHVATPSGPMDEVVLMPGQFFSAADGSGRGTQRLFSELGGTIFRSKSSDFDAPQISSVDAVELPSGAVEIRVGSGADDVLTGYALFRYGNDQSVLPAWHSTQLVPGGGEHRVTVTPPAGSPDVVDLIVQLVDRAGNVGISSNKGPGYRSEALAEEPGAPQLTVTPPLSPGGYARQEPTIDVTGNGTFGIVVDGSARRILDGPVKVLGEGAHTVVVSDLVGGTSTTLRFTTDVTVPTATITSPADGATYASGEAPTTASFDCADPGGAIVSCTPSGEVDTRPGTHTFSVVAIDRAGNQTTTAVTYTVGAFDFRGFFTPVDNDVVNLARRGSSVPIKFRLYDTGGDLVRDPALLGVTVSAAVCSDSVRTDAIEMYTGTTPGLRWDEAALQFVLVYKTESKAGVCRRVTISYNGGREQRSVLVKTT